MVVDTCSTGAIVIYRIIRTAPQLSRLPNRTIIIVSYVYISQDAFLSERPVQYVRSERTSYSLHTATIIRRPTSVLFPDDHDQDDDYNNTTAYDAYTDLYAYRKTVVVMLGRYLRRKTKYVGAATCKNARRVRPLYRHPKSRRRRCTV